ncbi:MAG: type II toxin-antitoxin system YafQ family toxin [Prevotella sp.]|nr:type II toxin-antitoxin system YafQ family toxin [Candidatus Equicola faecalis]
MWTLIPTGQFKKDLKRYRNRPEKLASLKFVLDLLREKGEVPHEYAPHMLKSDFKGFMECHVENDFLLIWRDIDTRTISLTRVGTHSELFKK